MLKGLILSDKTNFLFTLKQHFVQLKLIVHFKYNYMHTTNYFHVMQLYKYLDKLTLRLRLDICNQILDKYSVINYICPRLDQRISRNDHSKQQVKTYQTISRIKHKNLNTIGVFAI